MIMQIDFSAAGEGLKTLGAVYGMGFFIVGWIIYAVGSRSQKFRNVPFILVATGVVLMAICGIGFHTEIEGAYTLQAIGALFGLVFLLIGFLQILGRAKGNGQVGYLRFFIAGVALVAVTGLTYGVKYFRLF